MGWLKEIGLGILKGAQVFTGFSPPIKSQLSDRGDIVVDKISDTLNEMAGLVVLTESIGAALKLSGEQKLDATVPLVTQLILKSDLMTGKEINDQAKFTEGIKNLTNGVVAILNSVKDK